MVAAHGVVTGAAEDVVVAALAVDDIVAVAAVEVVVVGLERAGELVVAGAAEHRAGALELVVAGAAVDGLRREPGGVVEIDQ